MSTDPEARPHLSVVILGNIDAGKSTLIGHLLHQTGLVPASHLARLHRDAEAQGHPKSRALAWVSDSTSTERERGISIDLSIHRFATENIDWTICDAPGHADYMKNAVTGAATADVGVFVVPATRGEFEASMAEDGSARQHALLAFTLGVSRLVVAVNKMDDTSVGFSSERFSTVSADVMTYLGQIGFSDNQVTCVPISALEGLNLHTLDTEHMPWYTGQTVSEALDDTDSPERHDDKPLRMVVTGAYRIGGVGTVPAGVIAAGKMSMGDRLVVAPSMCTAECASIESHRTPIESATAGRTIGFHAKSLPVSKVSRGSVFGPEGEHAPRPASSFTAQLIILDHPGEIFVGYSPVLDIHTAHVSCRVSTIHSIVDRFTGEVLEENPRAISAGDAAIVTMVPTKPLVVEDVREYPMLGRFTIRDMRKVIAVGVVRAVEKNMDIEVSPMPDA